MAASQIHTRQLHWCASFSKGSRLPKIPLLRPVVCFSSADMGSDGTRKEQLARIAGFCSGGGSNLREIHKQCEQGLINGEIVLVVSNVPCCGGVQYAKEKNIPTLTYPSSAKRNIEGLTASELLVALKETFMVDFIVLAGFLRLVPVNVVRSYDRKILNIHPGLLPSYGGKGFHGIRVHKAVVSSGARVSGPTVHFVNEEFDSGPILAQRTVPVYPSDTPEAVQARVLEQEHKLYPECVKALCESRVTWREDGIPILWEHGQQL